MSGRPEAKDFLPHAEPVRALPRSVIASDLDGTIKARGRPVDPRVVDRLAQAKKAGVTLILVSGRCMKELEELLPLSLFDAVVAENGAVLEAGGKTETLAPRWWASERERLAGLFEPGCERVIISIPREKSAGAALDPSRARIEFNVDRAMILPRGVDKATGLRKALRRLGRGGRLVCLGDGENDLPMFRLADVKVAMKNSVDELKEAADYVTEAEDGEGVLEAMDRFFPAGGPPRL